MTPLLGVIDEAAREHAFSGVVRVDRGGRTEVAAAYGEADRAFGVANTLHTRFGTASITKGFTALTVMALVERGDLALMTRARSLLGDDLPEIADDVTVQQLLAHRSGIGDYLDEDGLHVTDHVLSEPVHRLAAPTDYLAVLAGHPTTFAADTGFAYNNGGYVVLALLAERAAGVGYHDLVRRLVLEPAGMTETAFLRSDELPGDAARGYLAAEGLRTNVLHLPVVGVGDGGAYSTAGDLHRLWRALPAGRIVSRESLGLMLTPHSDWPEERERYGLGFHLHESGDGVWLEGCDAGVSAVSLHDPGRGVTYTVLANWTDGAWPIVKRLDAELGT